MMLRNFTELRGKLLDMATFSQRKGIKPLQKPFQKDSLDQELRNRLWSVVKLTVLDKWSPTDRLSGYKSSETAAVDLLYQKIWFNHFKLPIDSTPDSDPRWDKSAPGIIRELILTNKWYEALDLIEFIFKNTPDSWQPGAIDFCNNIFESENSAYRIVGLEITEITDDIEIETIETSLSIGQKSIKSHLSQALHLLSDKSKPDYRNAMKEAISAVEAACQIFAGKPGATLGDCLKAVKAKHPIHPALEQSLTRLYGYTSDSGGIRHALTDETQHPTFADAKFLLVSCTAFINYLWTIAAEAGLDLS